MKNFWLLVEFIPEILRNASTMMGKWYAGLNPQLYTIIELSLNYSLFLMVFVKKITANRDKKIHGY